MTLQQMIYLDVAAARDANKARVRLLKAGYVQAANAAGAARVANMINARKTAGQLEKLPRLVAQLVQMHTA